MSRKQKASEILAGAYALNAVTDQERSEFEACLRQSETLRAEVTELQDTAVLLGLSETAVEPPAYLRTRILAQIENTPQESAIEAPGPKQARGFNWRALIPTGVITLGATAALAIVVPLANPVHTSTDPVAAISAASDSRNVQLQAGIANSVRVVWSNDMQEAAVKVGDAKLTAGNAYQMWIISKDGSPRSAGLVQRGDGGWHVLDGKLHEGEHIAMTVEPSTGSAIPTTRPLFNLAA